jgi:hypothetical protein
MGNRFSPLSDLGQRESGNTDAPTLPTGLADPNFYLPFFQYMPLPKNTAITSYLSFTMRLPVSVSERLWVEFPSGCAGLVGVQLWRGVNQIFPIPAGTWFRSNGFVFSFKFTHFFDTEPFDVEFRGYNLDDTFQHTPWVALELHGIPDEQSLQLQSFLDTLR